MAIIDIKNKLSGLVGTVVIREVNGKPIMQSRPKKHKKSKAVQDSSTEFIYASSFGKDLRGKLASIFMGYQDANMYRRFLSSLYKTLQKNEQSVKGKRRFSNTDLTPLIGFDFNINSLWSEFISIPMKFNKITNTSLELEISEFSPSKGVRFPNYSSKAELVLVCHAYNENDKKTHSVSSLKIELQENTPHIETTKFQFDIVAEVNLIFVVATILYVDNKSDIIKRYINSTDLHPCQLVYAASTE